MSSHISSVSVQSWFYISQDCCHTDTACYFLSSCCCVLYTKQYKVTAMEAHNFSVAVIVIKAVGLPPTRSRLFCGG